MPVSFAWIKIKKPAIYRWLFKMDLGLTITFRIQLWIFDFYIGIATCFT